MTQKELLYVEDAYGHQNSIINILNETLNNLEDEKLCNYISKQISIQTKIMDKLYNLLEDKSNE